MAIAKWWKIDFHTHTPASQCFLNKTVSPEDWVKSAINAGLDAVVITDHNSAEWIEKIRDAARLIKEKEGKDLVIYPGIELCCGLEYTHILIIFDPKEGIRNIKNFLTECGIQDEYLSDTTKNASIERLQELIHKYNFLIVPAHFSKNKGLGKLNVNAIKQFASKFPIAAIEVRDEECLEEVKKKVENKTFQSYPAQVAGSDNPGEKEGEHSIDGLGKAYTWIKLSEHSLESLKMAFLDEFRIKIVFDRNNDIEDPNLNCHNYISGMKITKLKHVDDLDFRLSPNLNCVIGGRGTGKSTIVEMIRMVLHKIPEDKKNIDRYSLISGVITEESCVRMYYKFGSTSEYRLTAQGRSKREWIYEKNPEGVVEEYPAFPAMIFGQKEIYNLVDDDENPDKTKDSPILEIVDDSIKENKDIIVEQIASLQQQTLDTSLRLRNLRERLSRIPQLKGEIDVLSSKLEQFRSTGILEKKQRLDKINNNYMFIDGLIKTIEHDIDNIDITNVQAVANQSDLTNNVVEESSKNVINKVRQSADKIGRSLTSTLSEAKIEISQLKDELESSDLKKELESLTIDYNNTIKGFQAFGIEEYDKIETDKQNLIKELSELEVSKPLEATLKLEIENFLDLIDTKHEELFELRKRVIEEVERKSTNIKLEIYSMSQGNRWLALLRKHLGREDRFETEFETLKSWIFPENKLNKSNWKAWCEFILLDEKTKIEDISKDNTKKLFNDKFKKIFDDRYSDKTLSSIFSIQPEDRIQIYIKVNEGTIDINEGSPGQRCAAILAFIMNQGTKPLIIDQPEDDLDNSLIIDLVVENIRKMKNNRQIIIVTHNPNIPVLGDAEGIIMLDRDSLGKVVFRFGKKAGCIEEKLIKKGICDIMEGGLEAFKRREAKYRNV